MYKHVGSWMGEIHQIDASSVVSIREKSGAYYCDYSPDYSTAVHMVRTSVQITCEVYRNICRDSNKCRLQTLGRSWGFSATCSE